MTILPDATHHTLTWRVELGEHAEFWGAPARP